MQSPQGSIGNWGGPLFQFGTKSRFGERAELAENSEKETNWLKIQRKSGQFGERSKLAVYLKMRPALLYCSQDFHTLLEGGGHYEL